MNLELILDQITGLDDGLCIFAKRPWSLNTEAVITPMGPNFEKPENMVSQGFDYFLEVHVAKEVLEVFGDQPPTKDEQRSLLMFYAENDAYPDWVYER